jgi:hypothetical protein
MEEFQICIYLWIYMISIGYDSSHRSMRPLARAGNMKPPSPSSPHLSLHSPLTIGSISTIRSLLKTATDNAQVTDADAAVLIPLCNVDGKPGVLFEVRGKLRMHGGEVR